MDPPISKMDPPIPKSEIQILKSKEIKNLTPHKNIDSNFWKCIQWKN